MKKPAVPTDINELNGGQQGKNLQKNDFFACIFWKLRISKMMSEYFRENYVKLAESQLFPCSGSKRSSRDSKTLNAFFSKRHVLTRVTALQKIYSSDSYHSSRILFTKPASMARR